MTYYVIFFIVVIILLIIFNNRAMVKIHKLEYKIEDMEITISDLEKLKTPFKEEYGFQSNDFSNQRR